MYIRALTLFFSRTTILVSSSPDEKQGSEHTAKWENSLPPAVEISTGAAFHHRRGGREVNQSEGGSGRYTRCTEAAELFGWSLGTARILRIEAKRDFLRAPLGPPSSTRIYGRFKAPSASKRLCVSFGVPG